MAQHRIFTIDEIIGMVVAHLRPRRQAEERSDVDSSLYLPLVTVSRAFSTVALDFLWRDLDGLKAIESLRARSHDDMTLRAELRTYTDRVHSLCLPRPVGRTREFLEINSPIFSRLQSLKIQPDLEGETESPLCDALLLFCPSVTSVDIGPGQSTAGFASIDFPGDVQTMCEKLPFLQNLTLAYDHLEDIHLREGQSALHAICSLRHITVLTISLTLLMCTDILSVLSSCTSLVKLHFLEANEEWVRGEQIVPAKKGGFARLETLVLHGAEPNLMLNFLSKFPKCPIRHLEFLHYVDVALPLQQQFAQVITDRFACTLSRLRLKYNIDIDFPEVPMDVNTLLQLPCADLRELDVSFLAINSVTNRLCSQITRAWPHLRHLHLSTWLGLDDDTGDDAQLGGASYYALRMLAKHCPELVTLQIRLDLTSGRQNEREGPVTPQSNLVYLDLWATRIDDPLFTRDFLVECFPRLVKVDGAEQEDDDYGYHERLSTLCFMFNGDPEADENIFPRWFSCQ